MKEEFVFKAKANESGKARRKRLDFEMYKFALEKHNHNVTAAAEYWGVSIRTVRDKISKYPSLHKPSKMEQDELNALDSKYAIFFKDHLWGKND